MAFISAPLRAEGGPTVREDKTLVIGLAAPITGPSSPYNEAEGVRCMAEMVNERAGPDDIQVKVLVEDGASDDIRSVAIARRFIDQGAVVIHGNPFPSTLVPMAEMARPNDVLVFTPQTAQAELSQMAGDNLLTGVSADTAISAATATYAYRIGVRTAAILVSDSQDSWLSGTPRWFGAALEQLGGRVSTRIFYPAGRSDFSSEVAEITRLSPQPDAVFICAVDTAPGLLFNALSASGYAGRFFGCDALDTEAFVATVIDPSIRDRVVFASHADTTAGSRGAEFLSACRDRGFETATAHDILGAEMVDILVQAAQATSTVDHGLTLAEYIRRRGTFDLFDGIRTVYGPTGNPQRPISIMGFQDGVRVALDLLYPAFVPPIR